MTTFQVRLDWDTTFDIVRAKLDDARRGEERVKAAILKTQLEQDRIASSGARARGLAGTARFQEEDFLRRAEEAQNRLREVKRRGLPRAQWNRWEAEIRHWTAEAERSVKDIEQLEQEVRSSDGDARTLTREVKDLHTEVTGYRGQAQYLQQRLSHLRQISRRFRATRKHGAQSGSETVTVTARALEILSHLLGVLRERGDQALRLTVTPKGDVTLVLDTARRGDSVLRHRRAPVVLIGTPAPRELAGFSLEAW